MLAKNVRTGDAMRLRPHITGDALPHGGEVGSDIAAVVGRGVGRAVPAEGGNEERRGEEIETAKKSSVGGGASERHSNSSS